MGYLPLSARVEGKLIHSHIKFRAEVVEASVVPEGPPLHVDTHPALLPLHQLHVPHLLHVAGVAARACQSQTRQRLAGDRPPSTRASGARRRTGSRGLTNDEADFAVRVFIATGHHSPDGVVHHSDHVQVKLLRGQKQIPSPPMNPNIFLSDTYKGDLYVYNLYKCFLYSMAHSLFSFRSLLKCHLLREVPWLGYLKVPFSSPLTLSSPDFLFLPSATAPDTSSWVCL